MAENKPSRVLRFLDVAGPAACARTAPIQVCLAKKHTMATKKAQKIGWIGMGRMGFPMAERLIKAGHDVSIWNRTKAKAEPLAKIGGKVVDHLSELKGVDILFSIVATAHAVQEVLSGK